MQETSPIPSNQPGEEEEPQVFAVNREASQLKFNRREFLELSAVAAAAASLGGCGGIPQGLLPGGSSPTTASSSTSSRETIVNFQNAPLFTGPGTGYDRLAMLKQNDVLRIISRSADGNWLQVATPAGDIGWISSAFVDLKVPHRFDPGGRKRGCAGSERGACFRTGQCTTAFRHTSADKYPRAACSYQHARAYPYQHP